MSSPFLDYFTRITILVKYMHMESLRNLLLGMILAVAPTMQKLHRGGVPAPRFFWRRIFLLLTIPGSGETFFS